MNKASAYGAGNRRFKSCRRRFTLAGSGPTIHEQMLKSSAHRIGQAKKHQSPEDTMAARGIEPRNVRLLAVRSNQLSYETIELAATLL